MSQERWDWTWGPWFIPCRLAVMERFVNGWWFHVQRIDKETISWVPVQQILYCTTLYKTAGIVNLIYNIYLLFLDLALPVDITETMLFSVFEPPLDPTPAQKETQNKP